MYFGDTSDPNRAKRSGYWVLVGKVMVVWARDMLQGENVILMSMKVRPTRV
jgi:hypothetical protein